MINISVETDKVGILASTLCMIHCLATPFLFIAKCSSMSCCGASPIWWSAIDFAFLLISFFAIYQSSKNTLKKWIKYALWFSWILLLVVLINEKLHFFSLFNYFIYVPALMLVVFHVINLKYCKCKVETCCAG